MRVALRFDAVAHSCRVFLNGKEIGSHRGGFLPFEIELNEILAPGEAAEIIVEADNRINHSTLPVGTEGGTAFFGSVGGAELAYYMDLPAPIRSFSLEKLDDTNRTFTSDTVDLEGPDGTVHPAEAVHAMSLANLSGEFARIASTEAVILGVSPR